MSFSPENELTVRRKLSEKTGTVSEIGFVLPGAIYYADKDDFWAAVAPKQTRAELETTPVKFCAIYPLEFEDLPENRQDEPATDFGYEFYLFHERTQTRVDESSASGDAFNKKLLKSHSDFVAAWINLRSEFFGRQQLNLGDDFAVAQTNSLRQVEKINNNGRCEFVPGIKGFQVRLQLAARILLKEC